MFKGCAELFRGDGGASGLWELQGVLGRASGSRVERFSELPKIPSSNLPKREVTLENQHTRLHSRTLFDMPYHAECAPLY